MGHERAGQARGQSGLARRRQTRAADESGLTAPMVRVHFADGRVRDLPAGTMAHNRRGVLLVVWQDAETDDLRAIEVFDSSQVSKAEVYESDRLISVVTGDATAPRSSI